MTGIESWIPAISALAGAIIGGGFTAWATWYSFKKQSEKDIWSKKLDRLGEADKELFAPFLDCAYRWDAKRDVDDIKDILGALRKGRRFFVYCPKNLKQMLFDFYSDLEKTIVKREGNLEEGDIDNLSEKVKQIEEGIYKTLLEMEF
jgi:hypothetical protein